MRYRVFLTWDAQTDLEEIVDYVAAHDVSGKDDYVLDRMEEVLESLATHPERGSYPKELLALGMRAYRQVFFKPYRVIYEIDGNAVRILLIVDGRRDMQALLARRMLRGS